jgi:DNA-binding response OmpR family regulator
MSATRRILIIEDDAALRSTMAEQILSSGDFSVDDAESTAAAEVLLASEHARYDAILLDVGLPDGDGCDFCAKLRRDGRQMPIIMVTGADAEGDVIRGLDAGANDYLAKPFRLSELLARVRAQLRTFDNSENAAFLIGPFIFRPSARLLQEPARNRKIWLTKKESAVLKFLYGAEGKPVLRRTLLSEIWGYNETVSTHTVGTHIYRLRQKIEVDPEHPCLLVAENGAYRLNAANQSTA